MNSRIQDSDVCHLYKTEDVTQKDIAGFFGVTHQRIQQILKRNGIKRTDGMNYMVMGIDKLHASALVKNRYFGRWGMHKEDLADFSNIYGGLPITRFIEQKRNAAHRKIEWKLTFKQWWGIWDKSGKWGSRGTLASQYVMGRRNDIGPYSVSNTYITTAGDNISSGLAFRRNLLRERNPGMRFAKVRP